MAAALYPSHVLTNSDIRTNAFPQAFMTDLDFRDNRYPSVPMSQSPRSNPRDNSMSGKSSRELDEDAASRRSPDMPALSPGWVSEPLSSSATSQLPPPSIGATSADREPSTRSTVSYSLPPGAARRVVERYSLDEPPLEPQLSPTESAIEAQQQNGLGYRNGSNSQFRQPELSPSLPPSAPRHPSLPAAGIGTSPGTSGSNIPAPIMPLSASPNYNPPVSPRLRTYPQQPTYINSNAPNAVFAAARKPVEEICIECSMRDQDMADVDVTTPGIWERESDVMYEDLKRREAEEEATGIINSDEPPRPKSQGGRLTEENLKIWLSMNPREPASRQQTLTNYLRTQRTLLEAEALAHARAMQEAKQLDNKMRDAYSRLRNSAYDTGGSPVPDDGGVRIRPPVSPTPYAQHLAHEASHSRDLTLLENGMIVEHVDVRKEEREARERRRKEERRMRKSSRGSAVDVTSLMSTQSLNPQTDSGLGLKPYSHYSASNSLGRPMSVATAPLDRPEYPRARSQASFSDLHSLGSASPRRSRFLGIGNFRDKWKSQDSLAMSGMSGSMVDMHVALQREAYFTQSPMDMSAPRRSQIWPSNDLELTESRQSTDKSKKKKTGLAKIWGIVTRTNKPDSRGQDAPYGEKTDDNLPLAPPPPLSYLVNHRPRSNRHASTPSLILTPKVGSSPGLSPPTAPSSVLPSPASSRPSPDLDMAIQVRGTGGNYDDEDDEDTIGRTQGMATKSIYPVTSEPNMRSRVVQGPPPPLPNVTNLPHSQIQREKSLPPLPPPDDLQLRPQTYGAMDNRPRTVHTFGSSPPPGSAPAHDFLPPQAAFRNGDGRRQSFGGMTSRPTLVDGNDRSTIYTQSPVDYGPSMDEFGASRPSLTFNTLQGQSPYHSATTPSKRKSRFALSSLLGKRASSTPQKELQVHQFPPMRQSGSDHLEDVMTTNGYGSSTSRHSAFSQTPRLSVISRKPLEELVSQDHQFVAYRYPSTEQRLDLQR